MSLWRSAFNAPALGIYWLNCAKIAFTRAAILVGSCWPISSFCEEVTVLPSGSVSMSSQPAKVRDATKREAKIYFVFIFKFLFINQLKCKTDTTGNCTYRSIKCCSGRNITLTRVKTFACRNQTHIVGCKVYTYFLEHYLLN